MNESLKIAGLLTAGIALISGCGSDDDNNQDPACSILAQNTWVKDTLREWYLENGQIPDLDPAAAEDPREFLRSLTDNVDLAPTSDVVGEDRFSVLSEAEVERDRVANIFSGFGLLMQVEGIGSEAVIRILDVFGTFEGEAASPASQAELQRGDTILAFDGTAVAEAFNLERLRGVKFIFGFDVDEQHDLLVQKPGAAEPTTISLTADRLVPTSVPLFKVFERGDDKVGYIFFRDFDLASVEGLRKAFAFLAAEGVTELIIDQRYNLGGFVFVIDFLAALLKGNDLADGTTILRAETWNADKSSTEDQEVMFQTPVCPNFSDDQYDCQGEAMGLTGLTKLVFINSGNTASASEVILNSMRSHVDVAIIGERSVGKPVGSAPFPGYADNQAQDFCGLVMRPITFRNVNADDEGDYFDGFVPDCAVADDPSAPIGSENEASITAALNYLEAGSCPAVGGTGGLRAEPPRRRIMLDADHTLSYSNSLARLLDEGRL